MFIINDSDIYIIKKINSSETMPTMIIFDNSDWYPNTIEFIDNKILLSKITVKTLINISKYKKIVIFVGAVSRTTRCVCRHWNCRPAGALACRRHRPRASHPGLASRRLAQSRVPSSSRRTGGC